MFLSFNLHLAAQVNIGFESAAPGSYATANGVNGWTVSSASYSSCNSPTVWTPGSAEFSVISTPYFGIPYLTTLPMSPLGGINVAQLNDLTPNSNITMLAQSFSVTNANCFFTYAVAMVFDGAGHVCCASPGANIFVKNCNGSLISGLTQSLSPAYCGSSLNYSVTGIVSWSNWQVHVIDLSAYIGSCVTIEIVCNECADGYHPGCLFFDAHCGGSLIPVTFAGISDDMIVNPVSPVNVCGWTMWDMASITAPPGFLSYTWTCPGGCQPALQNQQTYLAFWPSPGAVYTVNMTSVMGNVLSATYTLALTQTSIAAIGSSPSCPLSANGSATVIGTGSPGSPLGFTFSWNNSLGQVVSTTQVASNLAPGIYTVNIGGLCGFASATVAVGTKTNNTYALTNYHCLTQPAFLNAPTGGSNYQWYNNLSAISASLGGTASSYTVSSPPFLNFYRVAFTATTGCRDSVIYSFITTPPGNLAITSNQTICPNASNGTSTFSLTPALFQNSPPQGNSFYVQTAPATIFSSLVATPLTTFTLNNLNAGSNYTVSAFDGACVYSVSTTPYVYPQGLFNLTTTSNPVLCQGQSVQAFAVFTPTFLQSYQYVFSWVPNQFLSANNIPFATITPTAAPGTTSTIVYTVTATNTVNNCPAVTRTLSVLSLNPPTPTISPIPLLCSGDPLYTISVNPQGGVFSHSFPSYGVYGPFVTPAMAAPGIHTLSYSLPCIPAVTSTFTVVPQTTLAISGNNTICIGQSITLNALGQGSYTWSTGSSNPTISVTPPVSTIYTLSGYFANPICGSSASFQVLVYPLPALAVTGNTFICKDSPVSTTLVASGADVFYIWNTGKTTVMVVESPTATTVYSVTGYNATGCSSATTVTVMVDYCLGMETTVIADEPSVYPNPSSDTWWLKCPTPMTITIFDATGRVIYANTYEAGTHLIDTVPLDKGVYPTRINIGKTSGFVKLIRN